jgi:hypothetical protein
MGTHIKGLLGGVSGKVGPVIGARWKGIEYFRSRPNKSNKASTNPKVLAQRAKFSVVHNFMRSIRSLIKVGYQDTGDKMSARNNAVSQLLENAITGEYPDFKIDYSKVFVSKGTLVKPMNPAVAAADDSMIAFTWMNNSGLNEASPTDKTILVAYCDELKEAVYIAHGATRNSAADKLNAKFFTGKLVHTWIAFISDTNVVSDSLYTGTVTVS